MNLDTFLNLNHCQLNHYLFCGSFSKLGGMQLPTLTSLGELLRPT
jgi:hypothetical protein